MTLEESLQWCQKNQVRIHFYTNTSGKECIRIMKHSTVLSEECGTLPEAALKAQERLALIIKNGFWYLF